VGRRCRPISDRLATDMNKGVRGVASYC